ncbi:single-stranded-DNA-specific exonuclease RecJ [Cyanobium sp. CH-040]|uniref:single-stranded-DNA-specific exonuclease RecJ n=1 Tax=Cyanobium sp. CH-040 TaxID=2823708 RepID=UPI0020CDCFAA|nr:single-stranded-DNA-specific exonuclease RecJ [Cyanobium sp. CH-040]MCP9927572.1 single-stranded-DNA-specific exonuclease RecJ [Cyanobium sp. CH-040]
MGGRTAVAALLPALHEQRWQLPAALGALSDPTALRQLNPPGAEPLPEPLLALLARRGHTSAEAVAALLAPPAAPEPLEHFADLAVAAARLEQACRGGEAVAICGDYDADGMTSTALLVGVLSRLGANPRGAIPSRMEDGYGLNAAMVEELAGEGVGLLVTVDNGVSAHEALERARDLGVEVILTDHHTIPATLPPHLALLHPQRTPEGSPFRGLAGVGLAYVLAAALCRRMGSAEGLRMAMDLFCVGTIADMAPLQGVNRRWLIDGLPRLSSSGLAGLQALQRLAGIEGQPLDAEAVAFRIAPRINAVGRLGDPRLVVELLTTGEPERALELARDCETLNRQRRELCEAIEAEALALLEADGSERPAFLLLAQNHWHHGVIGIVAARLVERLNRPCALLAGEGNGRLRASVRAPRGFAVDGALQACAELLERFGGHPAAGGFSVRAERLEALRQRLEERARLWLQERGGSHPVEPEALLRLAAIDREFLRQQRRLEPFGIGHPQPVYWSSGCELVSQKLLRGGHLQLELEQDGARLRAIGWRWQGEARLPRWLDVAYRLRLDRWQERERLQLELVGVRPSATGEHGEGEVILQRGDRLYWCRRDGEGLVIRNATGEELHSASSPDHPYLRALLQDAAMALGLAA